MTNVPENTKCRVCQRIFCCEGCCFKHEIQRHAIRIKKKRMANIAEESETPNELRNENENENESEQHDYAFCMICQNKPFALQANIPEEILNHIEAEHLPLECQKCGQSYATLTQLQQFSKCAAQCRVQMAPPVKEQKMSTSSIEAPCSRSVPCSVSISTQTSPLVANAAMNNAQLDTEQITPICEMNLRWKLKSVAFFEDSGSAGDCSSSLKNLSSINCSSQQRANLSAPTSNSQLRSTSTPLQVHALFSKGKKKMNNPAFSTSSEHSSNNTNSGTSPTTPKKVRREPSTQKRRINVNRPKPLTPLRHIMHKNINKALLEHRELVWRLRDNNNIIQNSSESDSLESAFHKQTRLPIWKTELNDSPLDLRLPAAILREQSKENQRDCELAELMKVALPPPEPNKQKYATESVIVSSTKQKVAAAPVQRTVPIIEINCITVESLPDSTDSVEHFETATHFSETMNSIYKTCESIEFISTTTEFKTESKINEQKRTDAITEHKTIKYKTARMMGETPITCGLLGSQLPKKAISFDTPVPDTPETSVTPHTTPKEIPILVKKISDSLQRTVETVSMQKEMATIDTDTDENESDNFYTPLKLSPKSKLNAYREAQKPFNKNKNNGKSKNARRNYLTQTRRTEEEPIVSSEHESNDDDDDDDDDDDGLHSQEKEHNSSLQRTQFGAPVRSLWSIMKSVIGLPAFKKDPQKSAAVDNKENTKPRTAVKRSASTRAYNSGPFKPILQDVQSRSLKRKRNNSLDSEAVKFRNRMRTENSYSPDGLSKRFRIQGRRPITRIRLDV